MFPVIRKTVSCQLEVGHFVPHNKPRRDLAFLSHVTDTEHDEGRQGHGSQLVARLEPGCLLFSQSSVPFVVSLGSGGQVMGRKRGSLTWPRPSRG